MQRLGFLKCIAAIASPSQGQTLEGLTQEFQSTITRRTAVVGEMRERFRQYVARFQLYKRYTASSGVTVELQDAYLSDPRLPSASGAITGDMERVGYRHAVFVEIPAWATRIGLIRQGNYSLTDRGKLLRITGPKEDWSGFDPVTNPFLLGPSHAFLFLYYLVDADGDMLQLLYRRVLDKGSESFDRAELGATASEALQELMTQRLRDESSGAARQEKQRAAKTINAIHSQIQSGGSAYGPRESVATPRAEPLVDCGWLRKPDPSAYVYQLTDVGKRALTALADSGSISSFLESDLMQLQSPLPAATDPPTLAYMRDTYEALKSGLGYVSIRELVLGSIASMLDAHRPVYSINVLEEIIRAAPAMYGALVRVAQGRVAGLAQVRIHPDAFRNDDDG